mgnify:CR=1 FL=1
MLMLACNLRQGGTDRLQNAVDALAGERRDVRDGGFKVADAAGRVRVVQQHVEKRLVGLHGGGELWADPEGREERHQPAPHVQHAGNEAAIQPEQHGNANDADDDVIDDVHVLPHGAGVSVASGGSRLAI